MLKRYQKNKKGNIFIAKCIFFGWGGGGGGGQNLQKIKKKFKKLNFRY